MLDNFIRQFLNERINILSYVFKVLCEDCGYIYTYTTYKKIYVRL